MSNINENEEIKTPAEIEAESMTSDLRDDNFDVGEKMIDRPFQTQPASNPFVKPKIITGYTPDGNLTPEQVVEMTRVIQEEVARQVAAAKYDPTMSAQVINKDSVPITDFSKITIDDIYDLSVNIEAKPFMSADMLTIKLRDTNYEPRWVNKNPQRLGNMIAKGFTYIEPKDIIGSEAIQTSLDSQGHYCFDDVVAMKIDKATYYKALRHAYERAVATTNQANSRKRAAAVANGYMQQSEVSNDFKNATRNKKMVFYDPEVGV